MMHNVFMGLINNNRLFAALRRTLLSSTNKIMSESPRPWPITGTYKGWNYYAGRMLVSPTHPAPFYVIAWRPGEPTPCFNMEDRTPAVTLSRVTNKIDQLEK